MNIAFSTDLYKVEHFKDNTIHVLRAIDCEQCREYDFFVDENISDLLSNSDTEIKIIGFVKFSDGKSSCFLRRLCGGLGFNDVFYEYHKK